MPCGLELNQKKIFLAYYPDKRNAAPIAVQIITFMANDLPAVKQWAACADLSQEMAPHLCFLLPLQGTAVPGERCSSLLVLLASFLCLYLRTKQVCKWFSLHLITHVWPEQAILKYGKGRSSHRLVELQMSAPLYFSSPSLPASLVPVGGKCCSFQYCCFALRSLCRVLKQLLCPWRGPCMACC